MCLSNSIRRKSLKVGLTNDASAPLRMKKESEESSTELPNRVPSSVIPHASLSRGDKNFKSYENPKRHRKIVHDYHDHANDSELNLQIEKSVTRGGVTVPFPLKLYDMLDSLEINNMSHIVSWQPHGRCFVVHKPRLFLEVVLTKYFQQKKYASFQRQLNLYGFSRLTKGCDKGGYYHELFLRGKRFLAHQIQRIKIKGTGARMASDPDSEPNFYSMTPVTRSTKKISALKRKFSSEALQFHHARKLYPHKPLLFHKNALSMYEIQGTATFEGMPFHFLEIPTGGITVQAKRRPSYRMMASLLGNKSSSLINSLDESKISSILSDSEKDEDDHLLLYSSTNELSKISHENMDDKSLGILSEIDEIADIEIEDVDDNSLCFLPANDESAKTENEVINDIDLFPLLNRIFQ